jgi:hypothetical protein
MPKHENSKHKSTTQKQNIKTETINSDISMADKYNKK